MSPSTRKPKSISVLPTLAVLAFVLAAASQAERQVFSRDRILKEGESSGRFLQVFEDIPRRETIWASDRQPLARQKDGGLLEVSFGRVPKSPGFFAALSSATGVPASEFEFLASSGVKYRTWETALTPEQEVKLQEVKASWRAGGVSLRRGGEREYPLAEAAAGLTGFLIESKGVTGLESSKEHELAGKPGKTVGLVDRNGNFLPLRMDGRTEKRQEGQEVTLTIDSNLQQEAFKEIRRAVELNDATSGVAIILHPKSGDILAMANYPSYDPNSPTEDEGNSGTSVGFNPATMSVWEPGSTFKALTLALALDEGVADFGHSIQCNGSLRVWSNREVRCDAHHGVRAHGSIDPITAIAKSCNVSAATWARHIGYEDMTKYIHDLGLVERANIGLPGEVRGRYHEKEYAKPLQLATFGFGQSLTCTPLGLAGAFGALGNGGMRMKTRLIKKIGTQEFPAQEAKRICTSKSAEQVLDAMVKVIDSDAGTGKTLRIPGYELGGKTGTAQKINPKTGTVEGGGYVSNFVGYLPARSPEVMILVMVDNPKGGKYYGGSVAGPVFQNLAKACVSRLGIPRSSAPPVAPPKVDIQQRPRASTSTDLQQLREKPKRPAAG